MLIKVVTQAIVIVIYTVCVTKSAKCLRSYGGGLRKRKERYIGAIGLECVIVR